MRLQKLIEACCSDLFAAATMQPSTYLDAGLLDAVEADKQDGVQMRDVARREAQRLNLGQLPVRRLCGANTTG